MNNTIEVKDFLNEKVDWNSLFEMINDLGSQLNERMLRFMKAKLIEQAIDELSNGTVKRVDQVGHDFLIGDIRLECKFTAGALTNGNKLKPIGKTKSIMLTNPYTYQNEIPDTFDYLIIVDKNASALISRDDLQKHTWYDSNQGLKCQVPFEDLEFIKFNPEVAKTDVEITIASELEQMLINIIDKYKK